MLAKYINVNKIYSRDNAIFDLQFFFYFLERNGKRKAGGIQ
jgi:hypothetical protein